VLCGADESAVNICEEVFALVRKNNAFQEEEACIAKGDGLVTKRYGMSREETFDKCRLCGEIVVPPGCSLGEHSHTGEVEIFYMVSGELTVYDDGGPGQTFLPGDVMSTGGGGKHSVRNLSGKPATLFAVIIL